MIDAAIAQKARVIAQASEELRSALGPGGELTESLGNRQQRRRQVAAVDAGDIPRMQRRERYRVVPVEEVPAEALQPL